MRTSRTSVRFILAASALLGLVLATLGPTAANADAGEICRNDSCSTWTQWSAVMGNSSQYVWWRQIGGHNCTNYVAWRMTQNGVADFVGSGNAADWGRFATNAGLTVDSNPTVGSIAWWSSTAGMGSAGHVAYVEQVTSNGVLVSEDRYGGQYFDWRWLASPPSGYIHVGGTPQNPSEHLEQVWAGDGWKYAWTGIDLAASDMSSVYMGGTWPQTMADVNGSLLQIYGTDNGWAWGDTGVRLGPGASISAVNMGGSQPQVMALDGGHVYQIYAGSNGWVKADTGLQASGQISSVNEPGYGWPMSMIQAGGQLYQAWGDSSGWHIMGTGVAVSGKISAVYMGGAAPQVWSLEGGQLYQTFASSNGWAKMGAGISSGGNLSAVNVGGSTPQIFIADGGQLYQVWAGSTGWQIGGMGVTSSDLLSAVYLGGGTAQVMKLGS